MLDKIKELREKTGAGVMNAKQALEEAKGNMAKAEELIAQRGLTKAANKADREVKSGRVYAYIHSTGRVGAMGEVACETDFVAKTDDFEALCKEMALQVASMNPADVEELMKQDYIRDGSKKIEDLVGAMIGRTGENIKVIRFVRFAL